jgi:hypothetical protein
MGGSSKSSSQQKAEGDVVFNNVDYGGAGSGAGPLKNFNVGRENTLSDNVFNVTDGGATKNALAANVAVSESANNTALNTTWGALDANKQTSETAINAVSKSASEAIKANSALSKKLGEGAFKLSDQTTTKVIDYAGNTNRLVTDFATDSNRGAYELSRDTLDTYENLVSRTGDQVTDAQVTSQQATGKALDYVFQSSKSATERQSENLIKYGVYGAVGIVGAISLAAVLGK